MPPNYGGVVSVTSTMTYSHVFVGSSDPHYGRSLFLCRKHGSTGGGVLLIVSGSSFVLHAFGIQDEEARCRGALFLGRAVL